VELAKQIKTIITIILEACAYSFISFNNSYLIFLKKGVKQNNNKFSMHYEFYKSVNVKWGFKLLKNVC